MCVSPETDSISSISGYAWGKQTILVGLGKGGGRSVGVTELHGASRPLCCLHQ